ncbi:MAG: hypothetical protein LBS51_08875 [Oscillospiraceae bacterium]|jgi:hypothetical protein|nr:hypothetical protein [Oscillospiraceae bacterium]
MDGTKYFAIAEDGGARGAETPIVRMDGRVYPGCMLVDARWYIKPVSAKGLVRRASDELLVFVGSDDKNPGSLNAEIRLRIENDVLTLTETCAVFVPGGAASGDFEVVSVDKPVFRYSCLLNSDTSGEAVPAEASAPAGTYAANVVTGYRPPSGKLPDAPEGFLNLLLYLDGVRLPGAPYMETVWFMTPNDTGPAPHGHDFDEFIGFIGTNPDRPEELGAELQFYIGDEAVTVTKSCLVYIPRGVRHSPIIIPKMERPIIHFSGGNGGDYARRGAVSDSNMFNFD